MCQALIVGDQHQGGAAFLVQFEQQVADVLAGMSIEVAGGFIGKQHIGFGGKCPGDRHALLLTTGKLARRMTQALAQADPAQQFSGTFAGILATIEFQRQHHVFQGVEAVQQLERLEHEPHMLGADACTLVFIQLAQGLAGQGDFAAAGQVEAGEQAEQGGLAGTGTADDGQAVALVQFRLSWCRMVSSPSALGTTLLRFRAVRMFAPMESPMRVWF